MTKSKNPTALITGVVAALIALGVAFGLPLTGDQKAALLGAVAPIVAVTQAIITWRRSTEDNQIVAVVGKDEAIAGPASAYPDGVELSTVPTQLPGGTKLALLNGSLRPGDVNLR